MLNLPRYEEDENSCSRPPKFNPGIEIAGKYIEMSTRSPKSNRHQVSLKSWGTEAKYVQIALSNMQECRPLTELHRSLLTEVNPNKTCRTYSAKFLVPFVSQFVKARGAWHYVIGRHSWRNLTYHALYGFLYTYGDQMSSTLFDLQSKQTLQLTVWCKIVINYS